MDRQTALILEYAFSGTAIIFLFIWLFASVIPLLISILGGTSAGLVLDLILCFLNPWFLAMVGLLVVGGLFHELKHQAEKGQSQSSKQQQQQQQQQAVTINIPTQATMDSSDLFYCTECGFQNKPMAKFCKKCGAEMI